VNCGTRSSCVGEKVRKPPRFGRDDKVRGCAFLTAVAMEWRNCRSLHCATPDFLWRLVALMECMRLSLRKGAQVALSRAAWQEIRVRFGRDDKVGVVRF
jgi:hypothetical protein